MVAVALTGPDTIAKAWVTVRSMIVSMSDLSPMSICYEKDVHGHMNDDIVSHCKLRRR